jgi:hypothetical protein
MEDIEYPYERRRRRRQRRMRQLGPDGLRRTDNPLSLYKALKIGYLRNEDQQRAKLKKFGYVLDAELSDGKQRVVAYNPNTKKALYILNGSSTDVVGSPLQVWKDWRTNLTNIPTGTLEYTPRFIQEKNIYDKIQQKYTDAKIVLAGHSQSGATVNQLTEKGDKGYTLDGALINNKENPNVKNYRVEGDIVSAFANPKTIETLPNPSKGIIPIVNTLQAHDVGLIQKQPIFL